MRCRLQSPYNISCIQWTGDNAEDIYRFLGYIPDYAEGNRLILEVMNGSKLARQDLHLNDWVILADGFDSVDCEIVEPDAFEFLYEIKPEPKPIQRCK